MRVALNESTARSGTCWNHLRADQEHEVQSRALKLRGTNMAKSWLVGAMLVGVVACAHEEEQRAPDGDALVIAQHDSHTFDATVTSAGASLHVTVVETDTD